MADSKLIRNVEAVDSNSKLERVGACQRSPSCRITIEPDLAWVVVMEVDAASAAAIETLKLDTAVTCSFDWVVGLIVADCVGLEEVHESSD